MPIWNHPGFYDQYASVMRHFLTDPVPFGSSATFAFTPGSDPNGAPNSALSVALWYGFGDAPYAAPDLPDQAEILPYSTTGGSWAPRIGQQLAWMSEAEDFAPMIAGLGIGVDRIQTKSYGEERPVAPEHDETAWSLNRRGEFVLYY